MRAQTHFCNTWFNSMVYVKDAFGHVYQSKDSSKSSGIYFLQPVSFILYQVSTVIYAVHLILQPNYHNLYSRPGEIM